MAESDSVQNTTPEGDTTESVSASGEIAEQNPATTRKDRRPRLVALYNFEARVGNELSFQKGDVITLIEEHESGMWKGELGDSKGYFPYNYVDLFDKYQGTSVSTKETPNVDIDPASVTKEGWLIKQGHVVKNWKQRWFVLANSELSYFKTKDDSKAAGVIDLAAAEVRVSGLREHCMELNTPEKVFYISTGGKKELYEWMNTIRKARPKV